MLPLCVPDAPKRPALQGPTLAATVFYQLTRCPRPQAIALWLDRLGNAGCGEASSLPGMPDATQRSVRHLHTNSGRGGLLDFLLVRLAPSTNHDGSLNLADAGSRPPLLAMATVKPASLCSATP